MWLVSDRWVFLGGGWMWVWCFGQWFECRVEQLNTHMLVSSAPQWLHRTLYHEQRVIASSVPLCSPFSSRSISLSFRLLKIPFSCFCCMLFLLIFSCVSSLFIDTCSCQNKISLGLSWYQNFTTRLSRPKRIHKKDITLIS